MAEDSAEDPYRIRRVAFHEAGHAVAMHVYGWPFERVSIVTEEGSLGRVSFVPQGVTDLSFRDALRFSLVCLAGIASERYFVRRRCRRYEASEPDDDAVIAWRVLEGHAGERGTMPLLKFVDSEAYYFVRDHSVGPAIKALAEALLVRSQITGRAASILIGREIPKHVRTAVLKQYCY